MGIQAGEAERRKAPQAAGKSGADRPGPPRLSTCSRCFASTFAPAEQAGARQSPQWCPRNVSRNGTETSQSSLAKAHFSCLIQSSRHADGVSSSGTCSWGLWGQDHHLGAPALGNGLCKSTVFAVKEIAPPLTASVSIKHVTAPL